MRCAYEIRISETMENLRSFLRPLYVTQWGDRVNRVIRWKVGRKKYSIEYSIFKEYSIA